MRKAPDIDHILHCAHENTLIHYVANGANLHTHTHVAVARRPILVCNLGVYINYEVQANSRIVIASQTAP